MHPRRQRRHHSVARFALALLGGLAVAAGLAGCARPGTGRLVTTAAERSSWPRPPPGTLAVRVSRVVDGDTFEASVAGRREAVRLIGVDTPETVAPGRPVEPYGPQASAFAKHWLTGRTLRLAGDAEPRDRYGRLLAYAWLGDGTFWNALLLAEGYAETLTIAPNDTFAGLFARLAAAARTAQRGLWANAATAARVTAASRNLGKKQRPAVRGAPVVPQPPVHSPDGKAAATRTCFPRLPCPPDRGGDGPGRPSGRKRTLPAPPSAGVVGPFPCSRYESKTSFLFVPSPIPNRYQPNYQIRANLSTSGRADQPLEAGRWPTVTVTACSFPSRTTFTGMRCPGLTERIWAARSSLLWIDLPPNWTIRSPTSRPDCSAGEPGWTVLTSAPARPRLGVSRLTPR